MAEPDRGPGPEVNADDESGEKQGTAPRQPIRSAPLRRRSTARKQPAENPEPAESSKPPEDAEVEGLSESQEPAEPGEDASSESGTEPEGRERPAADADPAPEPEEVEQTLGYRQRRRQAQPPPRTPSPPRKPSPSSPQRPQPAQVRYGRSTSLSAPWIVAGALSTVLLIAGLAASVLFGVGLRDQDRVESLRAEYSSFARQMVVNLTTLNPDNVDDALKVLQDKTSGRAQQQMQESMKQAVGLVREQNISTETTVLADAVTKAERDEGTVIVVYGWHMDPPEPDAEMVAQTFRWRVQLTRINGELKMTNFEWVT